MNNKKKNILIISPFFFPEPISTGKFNTDIAIKLRDLGNSVTVVCSHPFYPKWKVEKSNKQIDGIKIIRGGSRIYYSKKTFFKRLTLELWYSLFVFRKIFKLQNETDVLITVFPPSFAFYLLIPFLKIKINKIGMIHDLQEVYSANKKSPIHSLISFFINKVEKRCFNNCDKLLFLSEEMKEEAQRLYNLEPSKLAVQYPFSSFTENDTKDLEEILPLGKTNILYSGALGEKQNPQQLYEFFDYASEKIDNCNFYFFSQGVLFNQLKKQNKNPKIHFHNLVPKENISELYKRSSVQIIPQQPQTSKGSLPSKLPNLLASGTKILLITDKNSELEKLFKKHNLQQVVTSWDKEKLLVSLKSILKNKNNKENQQKIAKELFHIDQMIHKILS